MPPRPSVLTHSVRTCDLCTRLNTRAAQDLPCFQSQADDTFTTTNQVHYKDRVRVQEFSTTTVRACARRERESAARGVHVRASRLRLTNADRRHQSPLCRRWLTSSKSRQRRLFLGE